MLGFSITFDFLAVLFIMLGSKFSGNLAVESGEVGFQRFQLVFLAPLLGDDGFELGDVSFQFSGSFLVLGDDAGDFLQSVDKVHAGGMGVTHGDEAVVELVFVVAFDHKAVLNNLLAVNERAFRDYAYRKAIDLSDALVLAVCVGTLRQPLQVVIEESIVLPWINL